MQMLRVNSSLGIVKLKKLNGKPGMNSRFYVFLIDKYENEDFPIGFPNPIEAIKFRMELKQKDLPN
jgi:HTH-type transcriptional regulator/antitoxin HigA